MKNQKKLTLEDKFCLYGKLRSLTFNLYHIQLLSKRRLNIISKL